MPPIIGICFPAPCIEKLKRPSEKASWSSNSIFTERVSNSRLLGQPHVGGPRASCRGLSAPALDGHCAIAQIRNYQPALRIRVRALNSAGSGVRTWPETTPHFLRLANTPFALYPTMERRKGSFGRQAMGWTRVKQEDAKDV